ncbi:MAG: hypothetical protein H0T97_03215 [Actinobacteria bacterium]|nr:hypothetical protein [Actinomycetota bacterium]
MLRPTLAVALIAVAVMAPSALASQGGKYRGSGSDAGSRANITGTAMLTWRTPERSGSARRRTSENFIRVSVR